MRLASIGRSPFRVPGSYRPVRGQTRLLDVREDPLHGLKLVAHLIDPRGDLPKLEVGVLLGGDGHLGKPPVLLGKPPVHSSPFVSATFALLWAPSCQVHNSIASAITMEPRSATVAIT